MTKRTFSLLLLAAPLAMCSATAPVNAIECTAETRQIERSAAVCVFHPEKRLHLYKGTCICGGEKGSYDEENNTTHGSDIRSGSDGIVSRDRLGGDGGADIPRQPDDVRNGPSKGNASANNGKGGNYERTGHTDNSKGQGRNKK